MRCMPFKGRAEPDAGAAEEAAAGLAAAAEEASTGAGGASAWLATFASWEVRLGWAGAAVAATAGAGEATGELAGAADAAGMAVKVREPGMVMRFSEDCCVGMLVA